jgi:prophage regulatory protein
MTHKILRLPETKGVTGLSRSTIYLRMANGEFPKSISLGGRAVGWLEEDIQHWLEQKRKESEGEG